MCNWGPGGVCDSAGPGLTLKVVTSAVLAWLGLKAPALA